MIKSFPLCCALHYSRMNVVTVIQISHISSFCHFELCFIVILVPPSLEYNVTHFVTVSFHNSTLCYTLFIVMPNFYCASLFLKFFEFVLKIILKLFLNLSNFEYYHLYRYYSYIYQKKSNRHSPNSFSVTSWYIDSLTK